MTMSSLSMRLVMLVLTAVAIPSCSVSLRQGCVRRARPGRSLAFGGEVADARTDRQGVGLGAARGAGRGVAGEARGPRSSVARRAMGGRRRSGASRGRREGGRGARVGARPPGGADRATRSHDDERRRASERVRRDGPQQPLLRSTHGPPVRRRREDVRDRAGRWRHCAIDVAMECTRRCPSGATSDIDGA